MKLKFALVIPFLVLIFSCQSQENMAKLKAVDFEKSISTSKETIQLFDVRTLEEYNAGHIKNCILGDINDNTAYQKAISVLDKNKVVYVYCLAGGRSNNAANDLVKRGFKKVIELEGGMNAWRKANLPEEKSGTTQQLSIQTFESKLIKEGAQLICIQSKYCGPCIKMKPIIASIETENPTLSILKVDGGIDQDVMKRLNVNEIPTFIVFKNGKETTRIVGLTSKESLVKVIQ
jgi:rhodanese-related sulfurtransferase